MSRPLESPTEGQAFSGKVMTTVAVMVAAALIAAGLGLYLAARGSDDLSAERQARSARHSLELSVDELALQQETVAVWDESAKQLTSRPIDQGWVHDNIGSWLHRIFRQDEVFILDGRDRPLYASTEGVPMPVARYQTRAADLRILIRRVRGHGGTVNGRHARDPGLPLARGSTVRTTPRATHDSQILLVGGRPAAASAMLIKPSTPDYVRIRGQWPVLISVRYLDGNFLEELSARQLIDSPRFARDGRLAPGESKVGLHTESEGLIGYLVWRPELPGTRIFRKVLPINLTVWAILALFIGILGKRLRSAGQDLAVAERNAAHLAFHDPLTGLPNRTHFQKTIDALTDPAGQWGGRFGLLLLDLDNFKVTNDTMGHDVGDKLLRMFSERLRSSIRAQDVVARLGGDEFALVLAGMDSKEALENFAEELLERLRRPGGRFTIECSASVGGSLFEPGGTAEDLLKRADLALYAAKDAGRGVFRIYETGMNAKMLARSSQLSAAKRAIEQDRIRPHYQPKVDLRSGDVLGFEALLRWVGDDGETHGPAGIAAAFEDNSLAPQLSDTMIERVIADIREWQAAGLPFGHVAINAAAAELRLAHFSSGLLAKLAAAGVPTSCVQIEVTERVLLEHGADQAEQNLVELASAGIRLAWDDFGTGYASLTHLKQFPVTVVKIDQDFVRNVQCDPKNSAIVTAIVGLCRTLDINVVSEGVETEAQRDYLCGLGCYVGQGFLFGTAVPAASVPQLLKYGLSRALA